MTGSEGMKHTTRMLAGGSNIVGGVNPRKAGETVEIDGKSLPVFGTVAEAMAATQANVSVIFVPPAFAKAAVMEAIDAEIELAVVITEGIPVHDSAAFWAHSCAKGNKTRIIGPNCPGIISPEVSNAGITPSNITGKGPIGLVSKSGTLTYQMMFELRDIGFTTAIGIGGDPIIGTTTLEAVQLLMNDPETHGIIMIGEIGGELEPKAAMWIKEHGTKPVVGFIAGETAPKGRTMGHAGAIVSGLDSAGR
jgi:succinyl-CoA synthetase alpha subunit